MCPGAKKTVKGYFMESPIFLADQAGRYMRHSPRSFSNLASSRAFT
jgi:hypothetical protein